MKSIVYLLLTSFGLWQAEVAWSQLTDAYEEAPVHYSATAPKDAIVALQAKLAAGQVDLGTSDRDIVRALLRELKIPEESQVLVFSKTSLQRSRIDPKHPRSMFFSDDCYVGWCPGGLIEVASIDPELGPIFYAFDPRLARDPDQVRFVRDQDCLSCHGGTFVRGIPSVFVRSVPTSESGEPLLRLGSQVVDYRTPFSERWGGWYVTGRHGESLHQGNVYSEDDEGRLRVDFAKGANLTDLSELCDLSPYLAPSSDLVALMILEHQTAMHNAVTRAAFATRRMMVYQQTLQKELNEPMTEEPTFDSVKRVVDHSAQDVVDHLLFKDEAALPKGGVQGGDAFRRAFMKTARRDQAGHSLKDLDLDKRLFKNRCSYLIYAPNFQALPPVLKKRVYAKLAAALDPDEPEDRYDYLSAAERARIAGILRETLPDYPPGS